MSRKVNEDARLRNYQSDEVIIREGEYGNEMYKILSGSVIVYLHYGMKDEHVVGIYSKSRCFGDFSMFTKQPNLYTVVAYEEVLLMRITWDELEDFIRNNPKNAIDMMQNMSKSMALMQKNIDLLLEEIYDNKQEAEVMKASELKRKMIQYSMNSVADWQNNYFTLRR